MLTRELGPDDQKRYDDFVASSPTGHVIQSWNWGEFKAQTGLPVLRLGVFDKENLVATAQLTLHRIPKTSYHVGYLPKGPVVASDPQKILSLIIKAIGKVAEKYGIVFIKMEPNVETGSSGWGEALRENNFRRSSKWIFTEYNFLLDIRPTEEEILNLMHSKWRYNIRLSERKEVKVTEEVSDEALEEFLKLQRQTAKRQGFLLHTDQYYRDLFHMFQPQGLAHLLLARHQGRLLGGWLILSFGKTIYYPYGASATEGREVMPVHALVWKTIRLGKSLGAETFDMWGAANPAEGERSPIWGSHIFKEGFGPRLVHYLGTYDLVFKTKFYSLFNLAYSPVLKLLTWLR